MIGQMTSKLLCRFGWHLSGVLPLVDRCLVVQVPFRHIPAVGGRLFAGSPISCLLHAFALSQVCRERWKAVCRLAVEG